MHFGTFNVVCLVSFQSLNEALETFSVPVRIEDGFIGSITVTIPWSSLISDNMVVEVSGLEVTLTPKQRLDNSMLQTDSAGNFMHSKTHQS